MTNDMSQRTASQTTASTRTVGERTGSERTVGERTGSERTGSEQTSERTMSSPTMSSRKRMTDRLMINLGVGGVLLVVLGATACAEPDWAGGDLAGADSTAAKSKDANSDGPCPPGTVEVEVESGSDSASGSANGSANGGAGAGDDETGIDVDVSTLSACCEDKGKAHCVPEDKLSPSSKESLATCSGGFCVPDSLIAGTAPKSCTTELSGDFAAGACVSVCVKAVGDKAGLLKQGSCEANELCAPCLDPRDKDKKPTGLCGSGSSSGGGGGGDSSASTKKKTKKCVPKSSTNNAPAEKSGESKEPAKDGGAGAGGGGSGGGDSGTGGGTTTGGCCGGAGLCVSPNQVTDADQRSHLEAKECTGGNLCAPKSLIPGSPKPAACKGSVLITGEYDGVCLSNCLVFGFLESFQSEQGNCAPDSRCLPCKTLLGPTGAPGCE